MNPTISILIEVKENDGSIASLLESITKQRLNPLTTEIIILAKEDLFPVVGLGELKEDIQVIQVQEYVNDAASMNILINSSKGEFLIFLFEGDILGEDFILSLFAKCNETNQESSLLYASVQEIDSSGKTLSPSQENQHEAAFNDKRIFMIMISKNHLTLKRSLIPRKVFAKHGLFNERYPILFMLEYLVRLSFRGVYFADSDQSVILSVQKKLSNPEGSFTLNGIESILEYLNILEGELIVEHLNHFCGKEMILLDLIDGTLKNKLYLLPAADLPRIELRIGHLKQRLMAFSQLRSLPAKPSDPEISIVLVSDGTNMLHLARALDSLVKQNYKDFEVILVQNGGRNLAPWLTFMQFPFKIRHDYQRTLTSPTSSRLHGVDLARGRFIGYLDETNVFSQNHLSKLHEKTVRSGKDFSSSLFDIVLEKVDDCGKFHEIRRIAQNSSSLRKKLPITSAPSIHLNSILTRKRVVHKLPQSDNDLSILADWFSTLHLLAGTPAAVVSESTLEVHFQIGLEKNPLTKNGIGSFFSEYAFVMECLQEDNQKLDQEKLAYLQEMKTFIPDWHNNIRSEEQVSKIITLFYGQMENH